MTKCLFKYHCVLRKDGTFVSTYGEFSEDLVKVLIPLEMRQGYFHLRFSGIILPEA